MKKSLIVTAAALLVASHAFAASYWVVLRDGSRYQAKAKPVVSNGRAIVQLQSGGSLAIDPNSIDYAKSEEVTRLGGGEVLGSEPAPTSPPVPSQSPLGSQIHLRKLPQSQSQRSAPPPPVTAAPAMSTPTAPNGNGGALSSEVIEKFTRAFENVGIYEHTVTATGPNSLRAELTADNEEKVFNVLSAAAFLTTRNAGVPGANIQMVEIYMKTTTGGSAGRFQMSQADAQALYAGGPPDSNRLQDYYVRKVIF